MVRAEKMWRPFFGVLMIAALLFAMGCGADESAEAAAARAEEWGVLQGLKDELAQKRSELADLEARLDSGVSSVGEDAEELTEEAKAELAQQTSDLGSEIDTLTSSFGQRLVNYINDDPMLAGAEPTESQLAALRMKASEDLLIANEFGDVGGEWARSIAIAEEALRTDPNNTEVQERLAYYESMRYMTEDRLAKAEKGMTLDEVKAAVGTPSGANDRKHSETRRAFYYLKGPDKSAAAVFFQKKGDQWIAYKIDFNAVEGSGG